MCYNYEFGLRVFNQGVQNYNKALNEYFGNCKISFVGRLLALFPLDNNTFYHTDGISREKVQGEQG